MTRAWLAGDGSAPSRMRPALGQPTSPITISLPENVSDHALADRIDVIGGGARGDREVLPVRQDVDGDEIHRVASVAIAQPELPDVGVGHRHRHLRLHAADRVGRASAGDISPRSSTSLPTMTARMTSGNRLASAMPVLI